MAEKDGNGSSWHWAYLIPIMALLIPILGVLNASLADLLPLVSIIVGVAAVTLGVRSVLGYQHGLRMEELEAQKEIAALEARQFSEAQRILDLDERTAQLRSEVRKEQTN